MKNFNNRHFKSLFFIGLFLFLPIANLDAKKVRTQVKPPKSSSIYSKNNKDRIYSIHKSEFEKVIGSLTFMGYDKKTSSNKETFFLDNGSDTDISSIEIEISYYNSAGKLINRRKETVDQEFPHNETRKVDIPSWDKQKSFHYINSVPPGKGSTPYTVKFKVISFKTY